MEEKMHVYESDEIMVTYDSNRCIHAAECVKGLPSVFNPDKRPWIQPDQASAEDIAVVVNRCPTGALHVKHKTNGKETPSLIRNTISIKADGPIYFRGEIEVQKHDGTTILQDNRFALCRCGQSGNKPACDNSHKKIGFNAPSHIPGEPLSEQQEESEDGKLLLKMMKNGPMLVEGNYPIYSNTTQPIDTSKNIALCRCGGSSDKPFCDGTHKKTGFEG